MPAAPMPTFTRRRKANLRVTPFLSRKPSSRFVRVATFPADVCHVRPWKSRRMFVPSLGGFTVPVRPVIRATRRPRRRDLPSVQPRPRVSAMGSTSYPSQKDAVLPITDFSGQHFPFHSLQSTQCPGKKTALPNTYQTPLRCLRRYLPVPTVSNDKRAYLRASTPWSSFLIIVSLSVVPSLCNLCTYKRESSRRIRAQRWKIRKPGNASL